MLSCVFVLVAYSVFCFMFLCNYRLCYFGCCWYSVTDRPVVCWLVGWSVSRFDRSVGLVGTFTTLVRLLWLVWFGWFGFLFWLVGLVGRSGWLVGRSVSLVGRVGWLVGWSVSRFGRLVGLVGTLVCLLWNFVNITCILCARITILCMVWMPTSWLEKYLSPRAFYEILVKVMPRLSSILIVHRLSHL